MTRKVTEIGSARLSVWSTATAWKPTSDSQRGHSSLNESIHSSRSHSFRAELELDPNSRDAEVCSPFSGRDKTAIPVTRSFAGLLGSILSSGDVLRSGARVVTGFWVVVGRRSQQKEAYVSSGHISSGLKRSYGTWDHLLARARAHIVQGSLAPSLLFSLSFSTPSAYLPEKLPIEYSVYSAVLFYVLVYLCGSILSWKNLKVSLLRDSGLFWEFSQ